MSAEVLVIGAGPAGLEAAITAAGSGCSVTVVDHGQSFGGQLSTQTTRLARADPFYGGLCRHEVGKLLEAAARGAGVNLVGGTLVWGLFEGPRVGVLRGGQSAVLSAPTVIVAAGAVENPCPFRGWTLPGVMMAGAAQTLLNRHRFLPGRRVVVLGSGNIGLAAAVQLKAEGAEIVAIVEPGSAVQASALYQEELHRAGLAVSLGKTVLEARGSGPLEQVVIADVTDRDELVAGSEVTVAADLIILGMGSSPLLELVRSAGCAVRYAAGIRAHVPTCNRRLATTVSGVLVAGAAAGARELSEIVATGRIAGVSAAEAAGLVTAAEAATRRAELWALAAAVAEHAQGEA